MTQRTTLSYADMTSPQVLAALCDALAEIERLRAAQRLVDLEAAAFREMAPFLDRLHSLSQRLGWPLGRLVIQSAVEQLERDHPRRVN